MIPSCRELICRRESMHSRSTKQGGLGKQKLLIKGWLVVWLKEKSLDSVGRENEPWQFVVRRSYSQALCIYTDALRLIRTLSAALRLGGRVQGHFRWADLGGPGWVRSAVAAWSGRMWMYAMCGVWCVLWCVCTCTWCVWCGVVWCGVRDVWVLLRFNADRGWYWQTEVTISSFSGWREERGNSR